MEKGAVHPHVRHATLVGWRVTGLRLFEDSHYPVLAVTAFDPATGRPVLRWQPGEATAARTQPL
jgi:hypothetical protein